jgi:hypothetical protein
MRKAIPMLRTNIYLTPRQAAALKAMSMHGSVSSAALVRRAVDEYLARQGARK